MSKKDDTAPKKDIESKLSKSKKLTQALAKKKKGRKGKGKK